MARRRSTTIRICGPGDDGCWVYGTRVADEHVFEDPDATGSWPHGEGPLCLACGVPRGTLDLERADTAHVAETGHHLGTGACEDACGAAIAGGPS